MSAHPSSLWSTAGTKLDSCEFQQLFNRHYKTLTQQAYRTTGCRFEAEEVVLDIFTKLWHQGRRIAVHSNPEAYLRAAVRNRSVDYLRKRKRQRTVQAELPIHRPCSAPLPDSAAAAKELSQIIECAIQDLPPKGQKIFRLNRFEDMTYQQIAEHFGLSYKTVETHMRRNLIFLRNRLQPFVDSAL
ncbi:MAG: RNA polymerase sigma-70 factor [Bacteroidota bacterium]